MLRSSALLALYLVLAPVRGQFGPDLSVHIQHFTSYALRDGDIDSDGDPDLIALSIQSGFQFLENVDGAGQLVPHQVIIPALPSTMERFVVMDLDEDGRPDLVLSMTSGSLRWIRNNGDGTWADPATIPPLTTNTSDFAIGDLDGDGHEDIVLLVDNSLKWARNLGGGAFATAQTVPLVAPGVISDVQLLDMDGDLDPDLFVAQAANHRYSIFENAGGMSFPLFHQFDAASSQSGMFALDVDLDGSGDLVVLQSTGWTWFRNAGGGDFEEHPTATTMTDVVGCWAMDLDGDGGGDLLMKGTSGIFQFLDTGSGLSFAGMLPAAPPQDPDAFSNGWVADLDQDGTREAYLSYQLHLYRYTVSDGALRFDRDLLPGEVNTRSWEIKDIDGDGPPDLVTSNSSDALVVWAKNLGGAAGFSLLRMLMRCNDFIQQIRCGDFEGDGDIDIVAASPDTVHFLSNQGDGTFVRTHARDIPAANMSTRIMMEDVDGDGDDDFFVSCNVPMAVRGFISNGDGTFVMRNYPFTSNPSVTGFMDVDEDGLLDMVAYSSSLLWLKGDGEGGFTSPTTLNGSNPTQLADIDNDGRPDLVRLSNDPSLGIVGNWVRNLGSGQFAPPAYWTVPELTNITTTPVLSDMDGDGDLDLVMLYSRHPGWLQNDGQGNFSAFQSIPHTWPDGLSRYLQPMSVDIDNDGDLDLAARPDYPTLELSRPDILWNENFLGNAFRIEGNTYVDDNGNGMLDAGEPMLTGAVVHSSAALSYTSTNAEGSYILHVSEGMHDVWATHPDALWEPGSAQPATVQVGPSQPVVTGIDLGFVAAVDTSIIDIDMRSSGAVCSAPEMLWVTCRNAGTRIESGEVVLHLDAHYTYVMSTPMPITVDGNDITWSFEDLSYGGAVTMQVQLLHPSADDIGAPYAHEVLVTTHDEGGMPTGLFSASDDGIVSCSYDPNAKRVWPAGDGPHHTVDIATDHLDFIITFQNLGTDTAQSVVVRDQLKSELDPSRLQVLGTSHPLTGIQVEPGGELVLRFEGIQLPPEEQDTAGSHGYVAFRIGVDAGLPDATAITNTAEIHFDLNAPVVTNTTLTTLIDCNAWLPMITEDQQGVLTATAGMHFQWYLDGMPLTGDTLQTLLVGDHGSYTVGVTSPYGCVSVSDPYVVLATAVADVDAPRFAIVPNPFGDVARLIAREAVSAQHTIEVIDVNGRLVRTIAGNGSRELVLQRDALPAGLYVVRVHNAAGTVGSIRMVVD